MKKSLLLLKRRLYSDRSGSILIWAIFMIIAIGIAGVSMLHLTTTSTYSELFAHNHSRAYYIAESGGRYAIPQIQSDPKTAETNLNGKTLLLSNGDKFVLAIDNSNSQYTILQSTGIVNEGSWFQGNRILTYKIFKPFIDPFNDSTSFSKNWNVYAGKANIAASGQLGGQTALRVQKETIKGIQYDPLLSINWFGNNNFPDLASTRSENNGLLSYELQVKIGLVSEGSKGDHWMLGLSFRLDTAADSSYGISFFKSIGRSDKFRPVWIDQLPNSFDVMMDESGVKKYIVFWKKMSGVFTLIDYKQLMQSDRVIDSNGQLKLFSAMIIKIYEEYDANNGRMNKIYGYVQGPDTYPVNTINWNFNNFKIVLWNTYVQPIIDTSLTSVNFETGHPAEIGIHAYLYDSAAANDLFFKDFAMSILSSNGIGGIESIQY